MKRVVFTILCISFFFHDLYAQKENNYWVAGINVKVDFNTPVPTASMGQIMLEGSCAVSNRHTGALLFSSNGLKIWDANGNVMPNGSGLIGGSSPTTNSTMQGALIVPFIDDTTKYYVFTLQGQDSPNTTPGALHYSVVDMTLNSGLGDVVPTQKNIFVHDSLSEGMAAVKGDGCSVWVLTHERINNVYKAFRVTAAGVNITPVVSTVPDVIYNPAAYTWPSTPYNFTVLKSDLDGKYLAMIAQGYAILNDFDNVSGIVSNPLTLDSNDNTQDSYATYGCFSPGGNCFYVSEQSASSTEELHQFDLSSGNPTTMQASGVIIDTGRWSDIQIVDDKVYVVKWFQVNNGCGVINDPDVAGTGCNFDPIGFNFLTGSLIPGTTQNYVVYANPGTSYNSKDTSGCSTNMPLSGRPNALSYLWNTGTAAQTITITAPGTYWVVSQFACNTIVDTFHVTHQSDTITSVADTNICNGGSVTLSGRNGAILYQWNNGSAVQNQTTGTPGEYWVMSVLQCEVFIDTFRVTSERDTTTSSTDSILCNGAVASLSGRTGADSYQWNNGSGSQQQYTATTAVYWVRSVFDCNVYIDTFSINAVIVAVDLGNDTTLCNGESITLSPNVSGATYLWQNGSTSQTYTTNSAGIYTVTVNKQGCTDKDTVYINVQTVSLFLDDKLICKGDTVELDITQPGASYLWQDGDTSALYIATEPGTYQATVTVNGCSVTDNFLLTHRQFPMLEIISGEWTYCFGETVTLRTMDMPGHTYVWQDSTVGPVLTVNKEGMYIVTITNDCGAYNDSAYIGYKQCDCLHYIPNVFTPNNDGKNDKIGVHIDCNATETELAIYNRWGNKVFYTKNFDEKWDGTYMGAPSDMGTYYFYYKFKSPRGEDVMNKGDFHLLR